MPRSDFEYIVEFTPECFYAHGPSHLAVRVWNSGEVGEGQSETRLGLRRDEWREIWLPERTHVFLRVPDHLCVGEGCSPSPSAGRVAFKVGKSTGINYLVLQVHYAHVDKFILGGTDNSGIILTLLPSYTKSVSKTAGVYLLGTNGVIRAGEEEHFEAACRIDEPVEIHPFAFRTHTHALGKVVSGYKIDKDGKWHLIGKHNPQEPQMFYPVKDTKMIVDYGDVLAARCTMHNFRDVDTYIGPTGEDEMCNFYMMYYVDGDKPLAQKYCYSNGPPSYYWSKDPKLQYIPASIDKEASAPEV
ncbi:peptidylglycine alpha-hydroxylating monooxygenase [Caerostris extrusa]|uniref:peptidylglycine monooxygenase n=1 Tax=Caerostris extrusa TaxID=172846 RepID=A0AAV4QFG6_CAEEX|nr:peptidylglycine alpha-hydroxylating monooxygenase [Caerostris extrusa]